MAKLFNFNNSKAGVNNYEPIYKNLFEVQITPPDIISNSDVWGAGRTLITDSINSIDGLDVDKFPELVAQKFKGSTRKFAGITPTETTVNVTINFTLNLNENNQNYIYNALRLWSDLIYDPTSGATTLKDTYTSKAGITVIAYNRIRQPFRKVEIKNVFISAPIPAMSFSYNENTILDLSISFHGDNPTYAYK